MTDVVTIGTATQDVYLISKLFRVIRDPHFTEKAGFPEGEGICFTLGGKIGIEDVFITTGGGATNAAVTFRRQGFRTACVARVGSDAAGEAIKRELLEEKITPALARTKSLRTAYSTLLLTPEGERTILVYRGASEGLAGRDIPWTKLSCRWAYIAGGGIPYPLLAKFVRFFKSKGARIALNPSYAHLMLGMTRLKPVLAALDVLVLNREEAAKLTGLPFAAEKKIFDRLDRAVKGIVVVTDGKRGAKVSDGKTRLRAGIFKERRLADRTGAGDSFGAGFVAGLMRRPRDLVYAVRLASANATSNVESIGAKTGLLTRREFGKPRWRNLPFTVQ